jgi:hypothetical protein
MIADVLSESPTSLRHVDLEAPEAWDDRRAKIIEMLGEEVLVTEQA